MVSVTTRHVCTLLLFATLLFAMPRVSHAQQPSQTVQDMPKIAVYVSGAEDPAINKAMTTRLITALANSGRYQAVENYKEFFEQAAKEHNDSGGASMNSERIERLGWQFGVRYVCEAEVATVLGENQISARVGGYQ